MKPFDLERAKAGDPIGICNSNSEVKFTSESPNPGMMAVFIRPKLGKRWIAAEFLPSDLCMKPTPIRFWVRPYRYPDDLESFAPRLHSWIGEKESNLEAPIIKWLGEAKLVEWP